MTKKTFLVFWVYVQMTLLSASTLYSQTVHYAITKKDLRTPQAKLSQVASKIEFIPLEFNKECLIEMHYGYQVTKAGENWLVSSSFGSGFIFNSEGKYLGKVGRKGKGPGEYTQFYRIMWDDEIEKYLMLMSRNRINVYNPDGSFNHLVKFDIEGDIWKIAALNGKWIFLKAVPDGDNVKLQYQYSDHNGITQAPVTLDFKNTLGKLPYMAIWNRFYVWDGNLRFGGYPPYEIYQKDHLNNWKSIYSFEIPAKPLPDNLNLVPPNDSEYQTFVQTFGQLDMVQEFSKFFLVEFRSPKRHYFLVNKDRKGLLNCSYDTNTKLGEGLIDDLSGGPCFLPSLEIGNNEWVSLVSALDLIEKSHPQGPCAKDLKNTLKNIDQNSNPVIVKVTLRIP